MSETQLAKAIRDMFTAAGILCWRNQSGTAMGGRMRFGTKGSPDIVCVLPPRGQILAIEVKTRSGLISDAQKTFRDQLLAAGGYYEVVRSVEQAAGLIKLFLGEARCNVAPSPWLVEDSPSARPEKPSELLTPK